MTLTEPCLAPGVPGHIADLFDSHEIEWTIGWGDRKRRTCAHGALLRPCAVPGDEIMWSILLSTRGLTVGWNDAQSSVSPVIDRLRHEGDPDEVEMVRVFGPNWLAARSICRTYASATDDQKRAAWAAWAAWAARAAWAAWAARAAQAARAARDAWDAWDAWAAWAAWDAWDAWAARDAWAAFFATITQPWIDPATAWTQQAYDDLMGPWVSVFGEPGVEVTS